MIVMLAAGQDYYKQLISEQKCCEKFFVSSGCCVICFNAHPLMLEEHHPFGRANNAITITVCANHHSLLSRMQGSWPESWLSGDVPLRVRMALADRALSDLLHVEEGYCAEKGGHL